MRLFLFAVAALALAPTPAAQSADCALGEAEAFLDEGDVRAALYNLGGLFWRGSQAQYEVPKYSGLVPLFNASLWVGGRADGALRFAGSTYGPWEFWPGPLDATGQTTAATCAEADRIWVVSSTDLAAYDASGTASADLAEWPVGLGAPFYADTNGNGAQDAGEPTVSLDPGDPGYGTKALDLGAGERPVVFGAQSAWWVMNDAGGAHEWSGAPPLGIEVRVTAWTVGADPAELAQSTFYRYEIVNRSTDVLDDVYAGLYIDADLGNFNDDYQHADSTRGMHVFYNGDNDDEGGGGYGTPPPAVGIDVLSGASSALHTLKSSGFPANGPRDGDQAYARLRGLLNDGTPMHVGGFGLETSGPTTVWSYPGDPLTGAFWSNENVDGAGTPAVPSDKRGTVAAGPSRLAPGERMTVDVAIVFGTGTDRLSSISAVRARSDRAQGLYDAGALTGTAPPPPRPAAPVPTSPDDGATTDGGDVRFTWTPVPGATYYLFELLSSSDAAEPVFEQVVSAAAIDVDRYAVPLNQRDPLAWRVRAVVNGVESLPSEPRLVTVFVPGFNRFSVVANATGRLDQPAPVTRPFARFPALPEAGPIATQQASGYVWYLAAEGASSYAEFLAAVLPGTNAERAFPHDFEIRFSPGNLGALDGRQITVPFELWDIGVGTPDDPADDVRMIPVVHDTDGDDRFSFHEDPAFYLWTTDAISWHRPLDAAPGQRGYRAWAEGVPTAYGPEVLAQTTFRRERTDGGGPAAPEAGTVVRIESSSQAMPLATDAAPAPLLLGDVRPNPVTLRGTLGFALAEPARVRLWVVDVLGRTVLGLVDGDRAAGEHRVGLDASALASGVYVLVLDADGERLARAFTVTR
ncbi:hypothetical protein [Rubrivirga sp. IMCC45206]|uniref:hypothetical protein n=1 Tax=Rubrivirga sp. IMCC45206 TaxID=3391614 RepID=UPI00398F9855